MMQYLLILVFLILDFASGPTVDPLRASVTPEEQRAFIKCHVLLGSSAHEIYAMLTKIAGRHSYSERQVYRIHNQFKYEGRLSSQEEPHGGRPYEATDEVHEEALKKLLEEQRSWSSSELAFLLGISQSSTLRLLKKLGLRKVAARWVPHSLTSQQKELRVNISSEHLQRYQSDPDMLNRIIAIDETWIKSYDPLDASQSREWRYPGEQP